MFGLLMEASATRRAEGMRCGEEPLAAAEEPRAPPDATDARRLERALMADALPAPGPDFIPLASRRTSTVPRRCATSISSWRIWAAVKDSPAAGTTRSLPDDAGASPPAAAEEEEEEEEEEEGEGEGSSSERGWPADARASLAAVDWRMGRDRERDTSSRVGTGAPHGFWATWFISMLCAMREG